MSKSFMSDGHALRGNPVPQLQLSWVLGRLLGEPMAQTPPAASQGALERLTDAIVNSRFAAAQDALAALRANTDAASKPKFDWAQEMISALLVHADGNARLGAFRCGEAALLARQVKSKSEANSWTFAAATSRQLQAHLEGEAGEVEASIGSARQAVALAAQAYKADPQSRDISWSLGEAYALLADRLVEVGDFEGAYAAALADAGARKRNSKADGGQADSMREVAAACGRLVTVAGLCGLTPKDVDAARDGAKYALRAVKSSASEGKWTRELVTLLGIVSWASGREEQAEVLEFNRQATTLIAGVVRSLPERTDVRRHFADVLAMCGQVQFNIGQKSEALESLKRTIPLREKCLTESRQDVAIMAELANDYLRLGHLHVLSGTTADAQAILTRGRKVAELLAKLPPLTAVSAPRVEDFERLLVEAV